MKGTFNNSRYELNGRVKPPIVIRSETEMLIAQNAHNLVWEKYRGEYDALAKAMDELKKSGGDCNAEEEQWKALHATAKQEIDELIAAEIAAYREDRAARGEIADIEERLERLEAMIDEIRDMAEEAQSIADDAHSIAEDALGKIEDNEKPE